jgi:hypothetical protein
MRPVKSADIPEAIDATASAGSADHLRALPPQTFILLMCPGHDPLALSRAMKRFGFTCFEELEASDDCRRFKLFR